MTSTRAKSFFDTSIFVYTFDSTAPAKRTKARALIADALENRQAIISYQVVQEFLNVATRKFARPLSVSDAQTYLTRVLAPLCEVFPDTTLFSRALTLSADARISVYDALIVSSALAAGCTFLLSEDFQHNRRFGTLQIQNPFR